MILQIHINVRVCCRNALVIFLRTIIVSATWSLLHARIDSVGLLYVRTHLKIYLNDPFYTSNVPPLKNRYEPHLILLKYIRYTHL